MKQSDTDSKKNNSSTPVSAPKNNKKLGSAGGDGPGLKAIVMTAICIVLILVLCIGVGIQQLKPKVVVTIGDTKIKMEQMMFPIYQAESNGLQMESVYQYYYGSSYWEAAYSGEDENVESGTNNSEGIKQEVLDTEIQNEILYQEALKAGYKLTDDEKKDAKDEAKKALKGLTWSQKFRLSISEKSLTSRNEKIKLAEKYETDKQKELDKTVDEDAAIKDISKKDYRGYSIQYCYAPLAKVGDDGQTNDLSASEKKKLADEAKKLAKKAKTAKDFSKLVGDDGKDMDGNATEFKCSDTEFTEKDGWNYVSESYLKKIKKMKNGEVSEALLDEEADCYIIVKMIDNNSTKSYQTACDNAIEEEQKKKYSEWFEGIEENYEIVRHDDVWEDVTIGSVTTDIVTLDDLEKMREDASSGGSSEE